MDQQNLIPTSRKSNKQQHGVVAQMASALIGHEVDLSYITKRMRSNLETLKTNNILSAREVNVGSDRLNVHRTTLDGLLSW